MVPLDQHGADPARVKAHEAKAGDGTRTERSEVEGPFGAQRRCRGQWGAGDAPVLQSKTWFELRLEVVDHASRLSRAHMMGARAERYGPQALLSRPEFNSLRGFYGER
jgi:hypothetical protein